MIPTGSSFKKSEDHVSQRCYQWIQLRDNRDRPDNLHHRVHREGSAYIGLYYVISSAAALSASLLSGYTTDKIRRRKPIITLGYVIGRGTFFLIPLIRDPILFLALAIPSSMTFGISVLAMQALQADIISREVRGSIFGIQELFMNGGALAGSLMGG